MDLLINYGTNASAGGQPVIAEIQIGASTLQYNITWSSNTWINNANGEVYTQANSFTSNLLEIIGSEILSTGTQLPSYYNFYNNGTYIPSRIVATTNFTNIPSNATHFRVTYAGGHPNYTNDSNLNNIEISYNNPTLSATTTFYDSYPGGTVIGTTNGTQIGGLTEYNISYSDNTIWDPNINSALTKDSNSGWSSSTEKIEIIGNQILFTTPNFSLITFYSNGGNTFLGYYAEWPNYTGYLGNISPISNVTIPAGATHFAISASKDNTNFDPNYSFAQIQQTKLQHGELTEYDFTYQNSYWAEDGTTVSHGSILSSPKIMIINDSIIIQADPTLSHIIHFWNGDTFLGWYESTINWTSSGTNRLGEMNFWNMTIPANATHFSFSQTATNFTLSYVEPGYLQIDPPTGKRIKQIALKGL